MLEDAITDCFAKLSTAAALKATPIEVASVFNCPENLLMPAPVVFTLSSTPLRDVSAWAIPALS